MRQRSIADVGRCIAVDTHPFHYASYVLPVRQYRILQSRFPVCMAQSGRLHCLSHLKPACDLLHFGSLIRVAGSFTRWKFETARKYLLS